MVRQSKWKTLQSATIDLPCPFSYARGVRIMTTVPKKTIEVSLETFRDKAAFPLLERAEETIRKSQQHLLGLQKPDGYWVAS